MLRYFAYGSNMSTAQMTRRCPDCERVSKGILADHRWIIARQGFASIIDAPGEWVEGVVWSISPADEVALDHYEDVHLGLYTKHHLPVMVGGQASETLVYIDPISTPGVPSPGYVGRLQQAILDADLDPAYVRRQIQPFMALSHGA